SAIDCARRTRWSYEPSSSCAMSSGLMYSPKSIPRCLSHRTNVVLPAPFGPATISRNGCCKPIVPSVGYATDLGDFLPALATGSEAIRSQILDPTIRVIAQPPTVAGTRHRKAPRQGLARSGGPGFARSVIEFFGGKIDDAFCHAGNISARCRICNRTEA